MFGTRTATLGPGFDGVTLGTRVTDVPPAVRERLAKLEWTGAVRIEPLVVADTIVGISIRALRIEDADELCAIFERDLATRWGKARAELGGFRMRWIDDRARRRATLSTLGDCDIVVEQYVSPATWVTDEPGSVLPLSTIGRPRRELVSLLGASASSAGDELAWRAPGIGVSDARFVAYSVRDTIVRIEVLVTAADRAAKHQLHAELDAVLTARHGGATYRGGIATWSRDPPISIRAAGDSLWVIAGPPPD